jgi:hypothetical protein
MSSGRASSEGRIWGREGPREEGTGQGGEERVHRVDKSEAPRLHDPVSRSEVDQGEGGREDAME